MHSDAHNKQYDQGTNTRPKVRIKLLLALVAQRDWQRVQICTSEGALQPFASTLFRVVMQFFATKWVYLLHLNLIFELCEQPPPRS